MKELEKLEYVLNDFKKNIHRTTKQIREEYTKNHVPGMDVVLARAIIHKLRDDKYIKPFSPNHDEKMNDINRMPIDNDELQYEIIFEGIIFEGYIKEKTDKEKKENLENRRSRLLLFATCVIAFDTVLNFARFVHWVCTSLHK